MIENLNDNDLTLANMCFLLVKVIFYFYKNSFAINYVTIELHMVSKERKHIVFVIAKVGWTGDWHGILAFRD